MGFYVSPEQLMADRADYARKGIARGRSVTVISYAEGVLLCAENPSVLLHKVSEIYDQIAFAGVGKYSEFDQLRIAGIRHADLKGYSYSRQDVDARGLVNIYAQHLSQVFTQEQKPMEVELVVAEVGETQAEDEIFHIIYDGSVVDKENFTALGGEADPITKHLEENFKSKLDLSGAISLSVAALNCSSETPLEPKDLEAAILRRNVSGRAFKRLDITEVEQALG